MNYRIITTFTLFAYLMGQWAVLPHAHAEVDPAHSERPHFHVTLCGANEGHTHDHHRDGNSDSQYPQHSHVPESERGHDCTAVYLPDEISSVSTTQKNVTPSDNLRPNEVLPVASAIEFPSRVADFSNARIAENCCPGCPLYLALRALRI
jgi:hypothetical protein